MQKIVEELFELSDEKYKKFHSSLCPNVDNMIGVRIPQLRNIAKKIAKENPTQFLETVDCRYYETIMLYGFVIGYMKAPFEERLTYLDKFVPKIDNWATCDCSIATYKFTNQHKKQMWEYIQKYIHSNREFEIRFGIVILMDYYLQDEYIDEVLRVLDNIQHEGYYVKMAVAWAISAIFIKYETKTRKFLEKNHLDDFTYNKALQKIIESNRVCKETKEEIRKMKR